MIPPTSIDGTDITGATIDGTDVQEITVDGDTVFTATVELQGLLLDDFADGKLSNRDDFTTTALNPATLEPGTSANTVTTRPEYQNIQNVSVNTSNQAVFPQSVGSHFATPLPSFSGTHEITVDGSGGTFIFIGLGVGASVTSTGPVDGYVFQAQKGSSAILRRKDGGNFTNLAPQQVPAGDYPYKVTFDDSGNFTFDADGPFITATDTTHNFDHFTISHDGGSPDLVIDSVVID
jgi:hypothetical protein